MYNKLCVHDKFDHMLNFLIIKESKIVQVPKFRFFNRAFISLQKLFDFQYHKTLQSYQIKFLMF